MNTDKTSLENEIQPSCLGAVSGSYRDQAMQWWEDLTDNEYRDVLIKTGNFRLGGWGHDIGPTEEDVIDMYKEVFNYR
jgi:hypothetical protein